MTSPCLLFFPPTQSVMETTEKFRSEMLDYMLSVCADNTWLSILHDSFAMIHIASVREIIQCLLEAEAWTGAVWSANAAVDQLGKEKKWFLCQYIRLMSLTTVCDTFFGHAVKSRATCADG